MALLQIARLGNPVIRKGAERVTNHDIQDAGFQKFLDDMAETMRDAGGVGIAAPQIAFSKHVFAVEIAPNHYRNQGQLPVPLQFFINPEILAHSENMETDWESCLSISDLQGRVQRWSSITLEAVDRQGKNLHLEAVGFFARIIQHELDHLNGIVFLDRMTDLSTLTHEREFNRYIKGVAVK